MSCKVKGYNAVTSLFDAMEAKILSNHKGRIFPRSKVEKSIDLLKTTGYQEKKDYVIRGVQQDAMVQLFFVVIVFFFHFFFRIHIGESCHFCPTKLWDPSSTCR